MQLDDIRDQIKRTEDLLNFHINKLKDGQNLSEKLGMDHTDGSKRTRNEILGGLGALVGIFVSWLSIDNENSLALAAIIVFIVIIVIIYFSWNWRFRKLNEAFGSDTASYDQRIAPLEAMLETLILMSINSYEGHFQAIREIATMTSFLNDATALYAIEPTKLLIESKTFSSDINEVMQKRIDYLKSEADYFYKNYRGLKFERIPSAFRTIAEHVFQDNKQYIDQKLFSSNI